MQWSPPSPFCPERLNNEMPQKPEGFWGIQLVKKLVAFRRPGGETGGTMFR